jgi:hypothetical protein
MRANEPLNARYLRLSGILSILGLLVEGVSLLWRHPLAPYLFFYVGLVLLAGGVGVFAYTVVMHFFGRTSG